MSDKMRTVAAGSKARQILVNYRKSKERGFQESVSIVTGITGAHLSACWGEVKKVDLLRPDNARLIHQSYPDFPLEAYLRAYIDLVLYYNFETKSSVQLIKAMVDTMSELIEKADKYDQYHEVIQLLEEAEEQNQSIFPRKLVGADKYMITASFSRVFENERLAMVDQPGSGVNRDILKTSALAIVGA